MDKTADKNGLYDISTTDIEGHEKNLGEYKGKVLLIVNVASKCGFTYQYEGLEKLYQKYRDKGLIVLGFPANDFLKQEPGSDGDIKEFCSMKYGVTFPMYSKITVKGRKIHPLYTHLTSKETNPDFSGKITWNFNKFLVNHTGEIVDRYDSKTEPESEKVTEAIEKALADAL